MGGNAALAGKVAVVTGGGVGIGRGVTAAFLAAGVSRVYIVSRKGDVLDAAARELDPAGRCIAIAADLSSVEGCRQFASELRTREERLHILVNNSGVSWGASFESYPEKGWDKVFQINLKAPFFLTQALADLLAAGGTADRPAAIINIGSIAGEMDKGTDTYAYGLSKGAMHHATRMLAIELGPRNISVNTIAPGRISAGLTALIAADPERVKRETAMIPLRRWGSADEVGNVAVFLASAAASYVTGTLIAVDGGLLLQHPLSLGAE